MTLQENSPTEKLYYKDAYLREFNAVVTGCEQCGEHWVITLDRTAFYPEGGGQPADHGQLLPTLPPAFTPTFPPDFPPASSDAPAALDPNSRASSDAPTATDPVSVLDVHEREGVVLHTCTGSIPPGTPVCGRLNWERRFDHMQQHSGEHIVSGMLCSAFSCSNVGFHLGESIVTIDYDTSITMEQLRSIEAKANAYIWENHGFVELWPDEETLSGLQYRSKKALTGSVRIASFPGADTCACCGTHVRSSGEIGLVKFLSCTKFHEGVRIELLCGRRAFDFLSACHETAGSIARAMSAKIPDAAVVFQKQQEETAQLKVRTGRLESRLFDALAEKYTGSTDLLLFEEPMSSDSVRRLAVTVGASCSGCCAVFAGENNAYKYALSGCPDVQSFVKRMNAALKGRGGGRGDFAQGSVECSEQEIRAFFADQT